jgi:biotin carboxylase
MTWICRRVMPHLDYVNAPFNMEFFWDQDSDRIWLLEINTRISKSHAPLFFRVDGCYHHQVMLDLALQRRPQFPRRQGEYAYAAKFMLRRYSDARVGRVPTAEAVARLQAANEGVEIQIAVKPGMRLSSLKDQDSYSYEVAALFIGGDSPTDLEARYRRVIEQLPLELTPVTS